MTMLHGLLEMQKLVEPKKDFVDDRQPAAEPTSLKITTFSTFHSSHLQVSSGVKKRKRPLKDTLPFRKDDEVTSHLMITKRVYCSL